jgi:hypothetical protein
MKRLASRDSSIAGAWALARSGDLRLGAFHSSLYRNGTAEIFDPATGTWTPTGSMFTTYWPSTATATLLPSGKVLVAGDRVFEQYDPQTGQWTTADYLASYRHSHTATGLGNGKVLLVAGWTGFDEEIMSGTTTSAVELYDPATGARTPTGSVRSSRADHSATLLMDGKVLISGGWFRELLPTTGEYTTIATLGSSEVYDPDTGQWTPAGDLQVKRFRHTATLLPDGAVLTVGGRNASGEAGTMALDSVELRPDGVQPSILTSSLNQARFDHTATLLPDGSVLVVGGMAGDLKTRLNSAEVYRGIR